MHTGWLGNNRSGQTFIRSDETIVLKSVRIIIKYPDSAVLSPIVSSSFDFPTLFTRRAGRVDGKLKWKLRENWGGSGGLVFFILEIIFSLRTKYENWKSQSWEIVGWKYWNADVIRKKENLRELAIGKIRKLQSYENNYKKNL